MSYLEFEQALKLFDLGSGATLAEIKKRHRQLAKRYHPDSADQGDGETMRRINAAYRLLHDYCSNYRFSFSRESYLEQNPEERLQEQFGCDPIWRGR